MFVNVRENQLEVRDRNFETMKLFSVCFYPSLKGFSIRYRKITLGFNRQSVGNEISVPNGSLLRETTVHLQVWVGNVKIVSKSFSLNCCHTSHARVNISVDVAMC